MVSASKPALAGPASARPAAAAQPVAHLNARLFAYLIDSVILVAFILVFFVISGALLLFTSDFGKGDAPDAAYYAFVALFLGGSLLSWTLFNLALMAWRGQTAGMYVVGVRAVGRSGGALTPRQVLLRWFGLHPLLFHPFLLPVWAILSLLVVSFIQSQTVLIVTSALAVLCLVTPVVGLGALVADPERRALHDRIAGSLVVHFNQP
jgi:uncharacterized RDD family membrane protein YckC